MSPVDHDPQSVLHADILTLLRVSCRSPKKYSRHFMQMTESLWRGPVCSSMRKSQQSLPSCLCVKHHVVGRLNCAQEPRVVLFFWPAKAAGRMVKIDHCIWAGGRNHSALLLAHKLLAHMGMNQMAGTEGSELRNPNRHGMQFLQWAAKSFKVSQFAAYISHINAEQMVLCSTSW